MTRWVAGSANCTERCMGLRHALPPVMMMKRFVYPAVLALALIPAGLFAQDDTRGAKEDMKDAGRATKEAAKDAGRATKKTAKKGARASKRCSRSGRIWTLRGARQLKG